MKLLEILEEPQTFIGWRAGRPILNADSGGTWFAETKEGAENFAISVLNLEKEAKKYIITLNNPKYFESFWDDYITTVNNEYGFDRSKLLLDLIMQGYDGMVIGDDTWNDTGDEYSVTSKQYVTFHYGQAKLADE